MKTLCKNNLIQNVTLLNIQHKRYFNYPCPRKLRELMQMSLIEKEDRDKIKDIWIEYHKSKPKTFGAIIDGEAMHQIIKNSKPNPIFLFPVKKKTGYYNLVLQNQENSFLYTFLEDYKANPSNATPYLVVTLFNELLFKKGIVLARGDIIGNLNQKESEVLLKMTLDYYTKENLLKKVVQFNHQSRTFNFEEHVKSCLHNYYTDNI